MKNTLPILLALLTSCTAQATGPLPTAPPPDNQCNLTASHTRVEYGVQSRWQLQMAPGTQQLSPGERSLSINVVCPYSRQLRVKFDGEAGQGGRWRYGEQGQLQLRVSAAWLDGQPVGLALTGRDSNDLSTLALPATILPDSTVSAVTAGHLLAGRNLTLQLTLAPLLSEQATRVTARTESDAVVRLSLTD
jgi:hypothetical protein